MSKSMTPNQREVIAVQDDVSEIPFYVEGQSADGSINVHITGSGITSNVNLTQVGGASITLGQKTMANSLPITIASDQTALSISDSLSTTGTVTSVNDAATNQTLLSSSVARRGFRLFNDSTVIAYVKYGTTATSTDYTVKLFPESLHYEDNYNGRVDCIWASDASGAMKVTSLS